MHPIAIILYLRYINRSCWRVSRRTSGGGSGGAAVDLQVSHADQEEDEQAVR